MNVILATAAEHPNTLPIIAGNPQYVGAAVIIALIITVATKSWKPILVLGCLFVLAIAISSQATGGIK